LAPPRARRYALAVSLTLGTSNVAAAIMAVFYTLKLCILIRIVMSWVDPNPLPNNELKRVLWTITDPVLVPLRKLIPQLGMFDFTPIIAILLLEALQHLIVSAV